MLLVLKYFDVNDVLCHQGFSLCSLCRFNWWISHSLLYCEILVIIPTCFVVVSKSRALVFLMIQNINALWSASIVYVLFCRWCWRRLKLLGSNYLIECLSIDDIHKTINSVFNVNTRDARCLFQIINWWSFAIKELYINLIQWKIVLYLLILIFIVHRF